MLGLSPPVSLTSLGLDVIVLITLLLSFLEL